MLAKLAGSALILGSTSLVGWQVAAGYARRPDHLRAVQTALAVLQTEMAYGLTPLPHALEQAAAAAGQPVGRVLFEAARRLSAGAGTTPCEALQMALALYADETALSRSDVEVLLALAPVLGTSGRDDQVRHLVLARERLVGEEARARDERARYERVARYAGVLAGAALVFILF